MTLETLDGYRYLMMEIEDKREQLMRLRSDLERANYVASLAPGGKGGGEAFMKMLGM